jgi:hypothetical protein
MGYVSNIKQPEASAIESWAIIVSHKFRDGQHPMRTGVNGYPSIGKSYS